MRREDPQPWERSCPVLHGPRAHDFWRGYGWLFLLASLVIHTALLTLLPNPLRTLLTPQQDILLQLKEPPPPPPPVESQPPPPQAKPRPVPAAEPERSPQQQTEPGPIIGVPGDGPSAIQSGDALPEFPATEPEPAPAPEPQHQAPPPPPPEPESQLDVKALLLEYAAAVKAQVLQRKYYPAIAERLGHAGAVKVGFTIMADGQLADVHVKSGSGWDELDEAALDAVRSAAPFDAIPEETDRAELALSITLKYTLD